MEIKNFIKSFVFLYCYKNSALSVDAVMIIYMPTFQSNVHVTW